MKSLTDAELERLWQCCHGVLDLADDYLSNTTLHALAMLACDLSMERNRRLVSKPVQHAAAGGEG